MASLKTEGKDIYTYIRTHNLKDNETEQVDYGMNAGNSGSIFFDAKY
ncbi:hypothetical protein MD588_11020 [Photobacterium sp. SDRW27]|nr:hypothetical protein [Photobacterium obscurum]MCW8329338.1 hypothetical protein [Photobacterium obscurum]